MKEMGCSRDHEAKPPISILLVRLPFLLPRLTFVIPGASDVNRS